MVIVYLSDNFAQSDLIGCAIDSGLNQGTVGSHNVSDFCNKVMVNTQRSNISRCETENTG
jgi:hypothetical protein